MLISDIQNKDELTTIIINELKDLGVKYRKEKKTKSTQDKLNRKRIFRIHLHLLELTDVVLANGGIVQIPQFVADACQRILEQVETEGLFRKAGSSLRQKEIKISLEAGLPLGKTHHVIDVANVVKSFFRELPEPLLPPALQEALLRSLLIGNERINAILMTCLLLPPLTINTLAFFMQFLNTVSLNAHKNKMSIENLAIIFTPGLMPFSDITGIRFNNHVKVVQILIDHAKSIGILPENIVGKLQLNDILTTTPAISKSVEALQSKKKKKRRSGSLTRMFNGFRKIVGAIGSSENLESTPENSLLAATPCISKSSKKRKMAEQASAFSAKKKKELISLMPDGGLLPNTPLCAKETKKTRLSLGGRRNLKYSSNNSIVTSVERRWSIVGSGWSRHKRQNHQSKKENHPPPPLSPVVSMPCISDLPKVEFTISEDLQNCDKSDTSSDYMRISKNEYEAIKERVYAIETRISQEFGKVRDSLRISEATTPCTSPVSSRDDLDTSLTGPERVLTQFEKTIEETESLRSPTTDNLAKRLSRELKIRRSSEHRIIRSPSARKIGTMRRRSKEAVRVSRNNTWHISSTKGNVGTQRPIPDASSFCQKSNLKRGRPNTLQSGLPHNKENILTTPKKCHEHEHLTHEEWTSGDMFFSSVATPSDMSRNNSVQFASDCDDVVDKPMFPATPIALSRPLNDNIMTPMLPPKSIPRKAHMRTPGSVSRSTSKPLIATRIFGTPATDEQNGRASIARLRAQNAGMVMAKAKLFDGMGNEPVEVKQVTSSAESRRRSNRFAINKFREQNDKLLDQSTSASQQRTPRRKNYPKSPGCVQKRQRVPPATKCSTKSLIDTIVSEEQNVIQSTQRFKNSSALNRSVQSPKNMPRIRKSLHTNSPRRIRTPRHDHNMSSATARRTTPLKATQLGIRNSPRLATHDRGRHY